MDGGAGHPLDGPHSAGAPGRPLAPAEGRRRLALRFHALQPLEGSAALAGSGRLGLESARGVGFPHPRGVSLRAVLHPGRRRSGALEPLSPSQLQRFSAAQLARLVGGMPHSRDRERMCTSYPTRSNHSNISAESALPLRTSSIGTGRNSSFFFIASPRTRAASGMVSSSPARSSP